MAAAIRYSFALLIWAPFPTQPSSPNYIPPLQHKALTPVLWNKVVLVLCVCISINRCLSFGRRIGAPLQPFPSACGCCRNVHRSHALLLGECGCVLPWLKLVKVLFWG